MKGLNGSFWHWQVSGMAISSVAACINSPNIHSIDCTSFQLLRSQHSPSKLILGFTRTLPLFCALTSAYCSIPCHPLYKSIPDTTSFIQPARSFILFSGNFYKKQLLLGKLLNTAKWSIFCVSFIHMLTILGWLWWFKIFKIEYLVLLWMWIWNDFPKSSHI